MYKYVNNFTLDKWSESGVDKIRIVGIYEGVKTCISKPISDLTTDENDLYFELVKEKKIKDIDVRTKELINKGVVHNGQTFSMTIEAQLNWADLRYNKDNSLMNYPEKVSVLSGEYSIVDSAECQTIIDLIFGQKDSVLKVGRGIVKQVYSATTISAVEAITDLRGD